MTEEELENRLKEDEGVKSWCDKGVSRHFSGKPTLTRLAAEALYMASSEAMYYWIERLCDVRPTNVMELIGAVPREMMSEKRAKFVCELLDVNRGRLLDAIQR